MSPACMMMALYAFIWTQKKLPLGTDAKFRNSGATLELKGNLLIFQFGLYDRLLLDLSTNTLIQGSPDPEGRHIKMLLEATFDRVTNQKDLVIEETLKVSVGDVVTPQMFNEIRLAAEARWMFEDLIRELRTNLNDVTQKLALVRLTDALKLVTDEWRARNSHLF